ncbi:Nn.00g043890.m01.CDS01 [Neocucurbitaria sp. VM-36]
MPLCTICQKLTFFSWWALPEGSRQILRKERRFKEDSDDDSGDYFDRYMLHRPTFGSLARSAESGCQFCKLLARALLKKPGDRKLVFLMVHQLDTRPNAFEWAEGKRKVEDPTTNFLAVPTDAWGYVRVRCGEAYGEVWLHEYNGRIKSTIRENKFDFINSTYSPSCFRLAKLWMNQCTKSHSRCAEYGLPKTRLPKRVIYIDPEDPQVCRLVEGEGREAPYIALSYCWGSTPIPKTTTTNIKKRRQSILLATLTKTFQDAIFIARILGIDYIWIDSMCIIQDNDLDWQEQAASMCDIYRQATLTIAAAKGTDGNAGCFSDRLAAEVRPVRLTFNFPEKNSDDPPWWLPVMEIYASKDVTKKNPLDRRAWCYQEEQLSPRMLRYHENGLHWSCISLKASEASVTGTRRGAKDILSGIGHKPVTTVGGRLVPNEVLVREGWRSVVLAYYQRQLTYQSDRFPALSGVALAVQKRFNDTYVAGFWRIHLHYELLWSWDKHKKNPVKQKFHPPEQYVAPSWSWASMKAGDIWWPRSWDLDFPEEPAFEILDVVCSPVGSNVFGAISNGSIYARGKLRQVQERVSPERNNRKVSRTVSSQALVASVDFDEEGPEPTEIWCFPVLCAVKSSAFHSNTVRAMLLTPTGLEPDEYRRVGIAVVQNGSWFKEASMMRFKIV